MTDSITTKPDIVGIASGVTEKPLDLGVINPAYYIEKNTSAKAPGKGSLNTKDAKTPADRIGEINEILNNPHNGLNVLDIEELKKERDSLKKVLDIEGLEEGKTTPKNTTTLDRDNNPKKDYKHGKPENLFEEGDIIDYMFKKYFVPTLDWVGNTFVVRPASYLLTKLTDGLDNHLSNHNRNVSANDTARGRFATGFDTYKKSAAQRTASKVSAPPSIINASLKLAEKAKFDDVDLPEELKTKLKEMHAEGKSIDKKVITEMFLIKKADEIRERIETGKESEVIDSGLLSQVFVDEFKRQTKDMAPGTNTAAKTNLIKETLLFDSNLKLAKQEMAHAIILQKHLMGSKKYGEIDWNNEKLLETLVGQEIKHFGKDVDNYIKNQVKKGKSLESVVEKVSKLSTKAYNSEKEMADTKKGKFFKFDHVKVFYNNIGKEYDIKNQVNVEKKELISKINPLGEEVYTGINKSWSQRISHNTLPARRKSARMARQKIEKDHIKNANEISRIQNNREK